MTHVTCRLTAKNRDQLRNPTLGNRVWADLYLLSFITRSTQYVVSVVSVSVRLSSRSTASAAAGGFAAEVGRRQQISLDSSDAAARHAGRVNFGPTVRRSNTVVQTRYCRYW